MIKCRYVEDNGDGIVLKAKVELPAAEAKKLAADGKIIIIGGQDELQEKEEAKEVVELEPIEVEFSKKEIEEDG